MRVEQSDFQVSSKINIARSVLLTVGMGISLQAEPQVAWESVRGALESGLETELLLEFSGPNLASFRSEGLEYLVGIYVYGTHDEAVLKLHNILNLAPVQPSRVEELGSEAFAINYGKDERGSLSMVKDNYLIQVSRGYSMEKVKSALGSVVPLLVNLEFVPDGASSTGAVVEPLDSIQAIEGSVTNGASPNSMEVDSNTETGPLKKKSANNYTQETSSSVFGKFGIVYMCLFVVAILVLVLLGLLKNR
ncbi:hypothetical protein [Synoicihabitans lomoniglobus]|uniref:Uncharacterized protein n=1 Tax=Synoicihabitans lomoniglobus TaxID=2909285 RepID=A0AAE9ZU00_9BACT|nr:hypothetical protein [Opitutaceae bacterium LMO-M01]WED65130.1 hypothetical protein PXH66_22560 [Opitutaceae bacterium LMO-M01]